jgi:quinol monooxygenase YgiN
MTRSTGYSLCGNFRAVDGGGDALAGLLLDAAEALKAADGCLHYTVHRVDGDPEAVWVLEIWADEDTHNASLGLASVQQIIAQARPMIAGMGERFELRPAGGLGLPTTED